MDWLQLMRRGDFAAVWQQSDADLLRRAGIPCWHLPRHFQYIWDGTPINGKHVLLRCYHGLGDTIQFIRYAPLVREIAASVTVWAAEPLLPLLRTVDGIDRMLPLHDGTVEASFDVDVEVMELPHLFRTTLETIPAQVPYIHADPAPLPGQRGLAVGLVWRAGDWDERRSITFPLLAPLFELEDITFYILQYDAVAAGWSPGLGIPIGDGDLLRFAQHVAALDLLITVDSMPAHIAGALAKPVWTLLHAEADWRWMEAREDSPWYPTMRLFRQQESERWEPVIAQVATELTALTR